MCWGRDLEAVLRIREHFVRLRPGIGIVGVGSPIGIGIEVWGVGERRIGCFEMPLRR